MNFIEISFASIFSILALGANLENLPTQSQVARVSNYTLPPITGQWALQLSKPVAKDCQEVYNFGRDQQFIGSSGDEITIGDYEYQQVSNSLPILRINTRYDNNATDCSGEKIDQSGNGLGAFVKQQGNIMWWCKDAKGKQCDMVFHRVLP